LSDFLDSDIYIGIVGGNLYTDDLQPTLSYDMLLPSLYWELNILFCDRLSRILFGANGYFNHSQQCLKVGYITGADMMVKKAILEKVGFFDPDFFMYYEETELTYRIRKRGYKVICIPQAKIVHFEGKSFSSNLERQKRLLVSRNLFYKKTHSQIYHLFANSICYLTAVSRIVIFTILRNKEKCKNWKFIIKNIRGE
jgi:GT2 family glycosyltransferase